MSFGLTGPNWRFSRASLFCFFPFWPHFFFERKHWNAHHQSFYLDLLPDFLFWIERIVWTDYEKVLLLMILNVKSSVQLRLTCKPKNTWEVSLQLTFVRISSMLSFTKISISCTTMYKELLVCTIRSEHIHLWTSILNRIKLTKELWHHLAGCNAF